MTAGEHGDVVRLSLHGVTLSLRSDANDFTDYVAATMAPFVVDGSAGGGCLHVDSRLEWVDAPASRSLERSFAGASWQRRPDRDLYLDGPRLYWLRIDDFVDLHLAAQWRDDTLYLRGRYHFQVGRSAATERLRRVWYRSRMGALRSKRFSTLLYYLVYHPILWRLSRFDGWHVLHGGAVATADGAAVFAGMPGCGKSTLSVAMLADGERRMLSDNLVLHDNARVRACPEVLLLDSASCARAGKGAARLVATGERRVYDRNAYRPDSVELEPLAPRALFCVERAAAGRLDPLTTDDALRVALRGNALAKEVRRYEMMAQVLDLIAGTEARDQRRDLRSLLETIDCYRLAVGAEDDLGAVVSSLLEPALKGPVPRGSADPGARA